MLSNNVTYYSRNTLSFPWWKESSYIDWFRSPETKMANPQTVPRQKTFNHKQNRNQITNQITKKDWTEYKEPTLTVNERLIGTVVFIFAFHFMFRRRSYTEQEQTIRSELLVSMWRHTGRCECAEMLIGKQ
jgi:hypothetical protein